MSQEKLFADLVADIAVTLQLAYDRIKAIKMPVYA